MIIVVGDMLNKYSNNSKVVTSILDKISKSYKVYYSVGNTEDNYNDGQVIIPFFGRLYLLESVNLKITNKLSCFLA